MKILIYPCWAVLVLATFIWGELYVHFRLAWWWTFPAFFVLLQAVELLRWWERRANQNVNTQGDSK